MKRTAIAFVALTMCLTTMAQDWRQMMSRVEEHSIKSEVLGAERNYTVFLPAARTRWRTHLGVLALGTLYRTALGEPSVRQVSGPMVPMLTCL